MAKYIAERRLQYALKGSTERNAFVVRVTEPFEVEPGSVEFDVSEGTAACVVKFDGLPDVAPMTTYGADTLQAVELATRIDSILKGLSIKYDFFSQRVRIISNNRNSLMVTQELLALHAQMPPNKALQQTLDPATLLAGAKSPSASSAAELWR